MTFFPSIYELRQHVNLHPTDYVAKRMLDRSKVWGDGWGTNVPLLAAMAAASRPGPILELGGGHFSTPVLKAICVAQGRELVTLETSAEWARAYGEIHQPELVTDWATAIEAKAGRPWSLVFVDNQPDATRLPNLQACRKHLDLEFLVTHDTVNPYFQGVDAFLDSFQYRYDYPFMSSHTTVVSDVRKPPV